MSSRDQYPSAPEDPVERRRWLRQRNAGIQGQPPITDEEMRTSERAREATQRDWEKRTGNTGKRSK